MKFIRLFLIIVCLAASSGMTASAAELKNHTSEIRHSGSVQFDLQGGSKRPSPLLKIFRKKQAHNRRLTAALIAFPFPFGMVGLHRIYLGCAPYVPVVYIASLGGAFGLLPFIDCVVLLADKDVSKYENNARVFMWIE